MTLEKCTPWHGGDVFLTSHAAFALEFEQSLQAIDARVTSAYWDYTLDDHQYHNEVTHIHTSKQAAVLRPKLNVR